MILIAAFFVSSLELRLILIRVRNQTFVEATAGHIRVCDIFSLGGISQYMKDIVIISAVRIPIGKFQGALKSMTATQLGAIAVKAAVERAGLAPEQTASERQVTELRSLFRWDLQQRRRGSDHSREALERDRRIG